MSWPREGLVMATLVQGSTTGQPSRPLRPNKGATVKLHILSRTTSILKNKISSLGKNQEVNTCVAMKAPFRIDSTVHI